MADWAPTMAADGLSFVDVRRDGVDQVDGLAGPLGLAPSPDGTYLYVAAFLDDAVGVFARDAATGRLAFVEVKREGIDGVQKLTGPVALTVSPDGAHLYVASQTDNAVVVFARDPSTGRLTFVQSRQDGVDGDGLFGAAAVSVSPDGGNVYVAGRLQNAVAVFARDPASGELAFVEAKRNGADGVSGLGRVSSLAISPDGAQLYATGETDNAVAVLARDPGSGTLTFVEAQRDGIAGVTGLTFPTSVVVSPDGAHVYVAANLDDAIGMFARSAATGALSFLGSRQDGVEGVSGLTEVAGLAVDPTGRDVFAASQSGAVAVFSRDSTSGLLDFVQFQRDGTGGIDGLQGATSVAVSPDGANLYAAGYTENALATFAVVSLVEGCPPKPNTGCRRPVKRRRGSLTLREGRAAAKNALLWKWLKGAETSAADLGDPQSHTGYRLCLYAADAGVPRLVLDAQAPAGDAWRPARADGFVYRRRDATPDGLTRVTLRPARNGKARIIVRGQGGALSLPTLPLQSPVKVQMNAANGQCWEADYPRPAINTARQFKASAQ